MVMTANLRRRQIKNDKSVKNIFGTWNILLYLLGTNASIIAVLGHEQMVILTQYAARTNNTTADGTERNQQQNVYLL